MIVKNIEYEDYNGNKRKEDFYFDLSKSELMEMELSQEGGMSKKLELMSQTQNVPDMVKLLKEVILKSYGVKSDDGRRFIKSEQMADDFYHSAAYSELFYELCTDAEKTAAFINGIIPKLDNVPTEVND